MIYWQHFDKNSIIKLISRQEHLTQTQLIITLMLTLHYMVLHSYSFKNIHHFLIIIPQTMKKFTTFVIICTLLLMAACLTLNIVIREAFYLQSLNFIISYQQSGNAALTIFFNIMSILVNTIFVCILVGVLYVSFHRKVTALVFMVYFIFNVYLMSLMKASFQEPRPFWYSDEVRELEWGCPDEFGNPSGHSWLVVVIYEPFITDFVGYGKWYLGLLFPIVAAAVVPLSRMYLGAHSGNQIMMGLTFGMAMCVLYRYRIQKMLYRLVELLNNPNHRVKTMIITAVLNAIFFVAPIIIFAISSNSRPIDENILENLSNACEKPYTSQKLQGGIMTSNCVIQIVFGALLGIGFSDSSNYMFLYGRWNYVGEDRKAKLWNFFRKLLVELALAGPPIIITILGIILVHNYYAKYFLASLGIWLASVLLVAFTNRLLVRFNIIEHVTDQKDDRELQKAKEIEMQGIPHVHLAA